MTHLNGVYELRFLRNLEVTPLTKSLDVVCVSCTAKLLSFCRVERMTLLSRCKVTCLTKQVKFRFRLPAWSILILLLTLTSVSSQSNHSRFCFQLLTSLLKSFVASSSEEVNLWSTVLYWTPSPTQHAVCKNSSIAFKTKGHWPSKAPYSNWRLLKLFTQSQSKAALNHLLPSVVWLDLSSESSMSSFTCFI